MVVREDNIKKWDNETLKSAVWNITLFGNKQSRAIEVIRVIAGEIVDRRI